MLKVTWARWAADETEDIDALLRIKFCVGLLSQTAADAVLLIESGL